MGAFLRRKQARLAERHLNYMASRWKPMQPLGSVHYRVHFVTILVDRYINVGGKRLILRILCILLLKRLSPTIVS